MGFMGGILAGVAQGMGAAREEKQAQEQQKIKTMADALFKHAENEDNTEEERAAYMQAGFGALTGKTKLKDLQSVLAEVATKQVDRKRQAALQNQQRQQAQAIAALIPQMPQTMDFGGAPEGTGMEVADVPMRSNPMSMVVPQPLAPEIPPPPELTIGQRRDEQAMEKYRQQQMIQDETRASSNTRASEQERNRRTAVGKRAGLTGEELLDFVENGTVPKKTTTPAGTVRSVTKPVLGKYLTVKTDFFGNPIDQAVQYHVEFNPTKPGEAMAFPMVPEADKEDAKTTDEKNYERYKKEGGKLGFDEWQTRDANRRAPRTSSAASSRSGLVEAVIANPQLYDELTPTAKTAIAPELSKLGFEGFGKTLPASAVAKIAESKSAIASLVDLRKVLQENSQYIGPVAGFQALWPYSEARQAQAKIDLVKQRVGKALEGGVLRKEDEEKYKRILATLNDTPETAISKVDGLIQTLESDMALFEAEQRRAGRKVGGTTSAPAIPPPPGGTSGIAKPNTQAEYNALPKGTKFIGKDGKTYIKE